MSLFAAVCASHAPLVLQEQTPARQRDLYLERMRALGKWVESFAPELIVEFAPDHFNGFFYDVMPNFCVGLAAESVGDWKTSSGPLKVPKDIALAACESIRASDIDVDISYQMKVDHGFSQILDLMLGDLRAFPLVPVMINCAAPPRPTFRRVRLLGEAIGRFARARGLRVLFVGSGGLSHDPPIPQIESADMLGREAMINGRNATPRDRESRETRVVSAALEFMAGRGTTVAPDPQWDRRFIDLLAGNNISEVDGWAEDSVTAVAGCGGHEVRTWIAAFSALAAATRGTFKTEVDYYDVVPEWMTGMGIIHAR